jgi:hypothetical protein
LPVKVEDIHPVLGDGPVDRGDSALALRVLAFDFRAPRLDPNPFGGALDSRHDSSSGEEARFAKR